MTSSRKSAFTLLEILLVVLVVGITVAAFLPVALNTVDQARTRSFLRQVISLNRFARSRALLDRTEVAVVYNLEEGSVRVVQAGPSAAGNATGQDADPFAEDAEAQASSGLLAERLVPDTMRIRSVTGAEEEDLERYRVVIDRDGVALTHTLEIVDPRGEPRRVRFNGFTGEADHVE